MRKQLTFLIILFLLVGCWDERLLSEHSLIYTIGYDLTAEKTINKTVTFPLINKGDVGENITPTDNAVITTNGKTVKDSDAKLEQTLPQKFDRSKARVILLGKDIAKDGIFPPLDSVYRDPLGPLGALVAVVDGTAEDALNIGETYSLLTSDFYLDLLTSAESSGIIKKENIQSICPFLLGEGTDVTIPLFKLKNSEKSAEISGLALFSNDKMTGRLTAKESIMFLLLSNSQEGNKSLNFKINNNAETMAENFVSFVVRKSKRKLKVICNDGDVKVDLALNLRIEVNEYPADHLGDSKKAEVLSKKIEKKLTNLANKTISKLQEANSDSLAIGQKVRAYHYDTWVKRDWKVAYPEIPFDIKINVEIVRHGILN